MHSGGKLVGATPSSQMAIYGALSLRGSAPMMLAKTPFAWASQAKGPYSNGVGFLPYFGSLVGAFLTGVTMRKCQSKIVVSSLAVFTWLLSFGLAGCSESVRIVREIVSAGRLALLLGRESTDEQRASTSEIDEVPEHDEPFHFFSLGYSHA